MTPHGMWIQEPHNTCVMKESISSTIKHVRTSNTTHQIVGQGAIKLLDGKVRQIPNVLHVPSLKKTYFLQNNLTNLEEKFPSSPKYVFSII
jgi:hypothetical protein